MGCSPDIGVVSIIEEFADTETVVLFIASRLRDPSPIPDTDMPNADTESTNNLILADNPEVASRFLFRSNLLGSRMSLSVLVLILIVLGLVFSLTPVQAFSSQPSSPTFVWFYGYVGGNFFPTTELGITRAQVLQEASRLSEQVGISNLRLVTAVDTTQTNIANATMIPAIRGYVNSLETYASVVYGRIDLTLFNTTSSPTVYQLVREYVNKMDLNGIWFDQAAVYYSLVGQSYFDSMMQNLTDNYPTLNFILNNAAANVAIIQPEQKDTWQTNAYISPTVAQGSYDSVNLTLISIMSALYPDRVLLHFDASFNNASEPMGVFADQTAKNETSAISFLAQQGADPVNQSESYYLLYPILGSWTYAGSKYGGTIYNSLNVGKYDRQTAHSFISVMTEY